MSAALGLTRSALRLSSSAARVAPALQTSVRMMSAKTPLGDKETAAEKQYFNVEDEKLLRVSQLPLVPWRSFLRGSNGQQPLRQQQQTSSIKNT